MARRKDQDAAREAIIAATLLAIRDRGMDGLRIRDVADIAGVSSGTVHYYFTDFVGLLSEVYQRASERFFRDRMLVVTELADARMKLSAMIGTGIPWSSDDALVTALYRLDSYLAFRDNHSALVTGLYDKQVALYLGILETGQAQGYFELRARPLDIAQNLVALEDAYGLHIITDNRTLPPRRAADLIHNFATIATGCQDIPTSTSADLAGVSRQPANPTRKNRK
ncbi:MAG: TetR/AcrR family transcriptional regulator [Mycobacterium sp.]